MDGRLDTRYSKAFLTFRDSIHFPKCATAPSAMRGHPANTDLYIIPGEHGRRSRGALQREPFDDRLLVWRVRLFPLLKTYPSRLSANLL